MINNKFVEVIAMKKNKYIALIIISSLFVASCNKNENSESSEFISSEEISEESSIDVSSDIENIKQQLLSYEKLSVSLTGNNLSSYSEVIEEDVISKSGFNNLSFNGSINYVDFDQDNLANLKASVDLNNIDGDFYFDDTVTLNDGYISSYVYSNTVYVDYSCEDLRNVISLYIYENETDPSVTFDDIYNELPNKFYISNYTFEQLIEEMNSSSSSEDPSSTSIPNEVIYALLAKIIKLNSKYEFLSITPTMEGTKIELTLDKETIRNVLIDLIISQASGYDSTRVTSIVDEMLSSFVKINISSSIIISYEGDISKGNISLDIESNDVSEDNVITNQYINGTIEFEIEYDNVSLNIPDDLSTYLPYEVVIEENKTNI